MRVDMGVKAAAALLTLSACAAPPAPAIVGLYRTSSCQKGSEAARECGEPTAVVAVTSNTPAADTPTSPASQFAERAEAEYIKALADPRMSKDVKALRGNLSAPLKAASTPLDHRHIIRNLTITTAKTGAFNPDDRLQQTEVLITLVDPGAAFTSWDNATSIYNTINAGTLQVASSNGGETDLSIGTPATAPVAASVGQKFTYSTTSTQSANGNIQAENLTVTVENNGRALRVFRQGGPGVDLTGNVAVKVSFALSGRDKLAFYALTGLFGDDGNPQDPAKVRPTRSNVDVGPPAALMANVHMDYVMRHVTGGGGSLVPGTQDVVHRLEGADASAILVTQDDAYPESYGVFLNTGSDPVSIQIPGLPTEPLCFATYDEAETLQRYLGLATVNGKMGDSAFGWNTVNAAPRPLSAVEMRRLEVRSNCITPAVRH